MRYFFLLLRFLFFFRNKEKKMKNYFEIKKFLKCTFLSLCLSNERVLSLYFQVGMYTYISNVFTPEKYEKKEKIRNCFLRPSGVV